MSDHVSVSFKFLPEEPDPDDPTGVSEDEYNNLTDQLTQLGAEDIQVVKL
jgi:hypothetical protein